MNVRGDNKLLSVVVPVFNGEKYIKECIESIRKQTYQNLEIIIVNDGSTDRTEEICERIALEDDRIILVFQENAGVIAARTRGVEIASGEYIAFVDADDYISERMYEKLINYMPEYDVAICGIKQQLSESEEQVVFDDFVGGYASFDQMKNVWRTMLYDFDKEKLHSLYSILPNKIFKKRMLLPIMQRMDRNINHGEDSCITLQYLLECNSAFFLREDLYYYRYNEESVTRSLNKKMLENVVRIYNLLKPVFDNHIKAQSLNKQLEKWIIFLLIQSVNKYLGFSKENRIPQYWVSVEEYIGKKIVVYGAGQMGQDIIWQCNKLGQEVYAWVDKEYVRYQRENMYVRNVEILNDVKLQKEIDVILIAVSNKEVADKIRRSLVQLGISEEVIVWKKPIQVY